MADPLQTEISCFGMVGCALEHRDAGSTERNPQQSIRNQINNSMCNIHIWTEESGSPTGCIDVVNKFKGVVSEAKLK